MSNSTTKQHSHYIPRSYFKPAMFALDIFSNDHRFNRAVDIAYHYYTADPFSPDYIPPAKLDRNKLSKHLLKWIANS